MSVLRFRVQGSSPDPYEVVFRRFERELTASCTCPAGQKRQHCKHRAQLLCGQVDSLISGNESDLLTLAEWLKGSQLERALADFGEAEKHLADAQHKSAAMKKRFADALNGRD